MKANEKVFVMLKPDCMMRGLAGQVISMFERVGLKIVDMKLINATREQAEKHYPSTDAWLESVGNKSLVFYKENNLNPVDFFTDISAKGVGIEIKNRLIDYLTMGPMVGIVFVGYDAIKIARKVAGVTIPTNAEMGSIRGMYSMDNPVSSAMEKRCIYNLCHVSDSPEAVEDEMKIWL